jgi:hypothetical protein
MALVVGKYDRDCLIFWFAVKAGLDQRLGTGIIVNFFGV